MCGTATPSRSSCTKPAIARHHTIVHPLSAAVGRRHRIGTKLVRPRHESRALCDTERAGARHQAPARNPTPAPCVRAHRPVAFVQIGESQSPNWNIG